MCKGQGYHIPVDGSICRNVVTIFVLSTTDVNRASMISLTAMGGNLLACVI